MQKPNPIIGFASRLPVEMFVIGNITQSAKRARPITHAEAILAKTGLKASRGTCILPIKINKAILGRLELILLKGSFANFRFIHKV